MTAALVDRAMTPPAGRRELRRFGLSVGTVLLLLALLAHRRGAALVPIVLAGAGAALVLAGAFIPGRLGGVYRYWMTVALAMSKVTTPIFMALVYYVVLTPFGLAMRLAGRRPLSRRRDQATFWVDRPPGERRSDLRRQF